MLKDLKDCTVYLLDFTSEVECTRCTNCQIFIGPVDGPAIFEECTNCHVSVACQQFQAKGSSLCDFAVYCATGPTLSNCTSISFSCWSGAYPGLGSHFTNANLDPTKNQFHKVYDASQGDGDVPPNFTVSMAPRTPWVLSSVEIAGLDAAILPENPVLGPDGNVQDIGKTASADDVFGLGVDSGSVPMEDTPHLGMVVNEPQQQSNIQHDSTATVVGNGAAVDATSYQNQNAYQLQQQRIQRQAQEEAEKKLALQEEAATYLKEFYKQRNATRDERIKLGREESLKRGSEETGPEGNSQWDRVISMIDFNISRPSGTDLSRFKSVLFACKDS